MKKRLVQKQSRPPYVSLMIQADLTICMFLLVKIKLWSTKLIMISSSNFFNKTLFHSEEHAKKTIDRNNIQKIDQLTPWNPQEDNDWNLIRQSQHFKPKKQKSKIIRQKGEKKQQSSNHDSNLFPTKVHLKLPPICTNYLQMSSQSSTILHITPRQALRGSVITNETLQERKKRNGSYDQISINQYLSQQRGVIYDGRYINRKAEKSKDQTEKINFLVHRHFKRWGSKFEYQSKTLDLRKQLIEPIQIYNRKSIVTINPEIKRNRIGPKKSRDMYRPLHNHRYYS